MIVATGALEVQTLLESIFMGTTKGRVAPVSLPGHEARYDDNPAGHQRNEYEADARTRAVQVDAVER